MSKLYGKRDKLTKKEDGLLNKNKTVQDIYGKAYDYGYYAGQRKARHDLKKSKMKRVS